MSVTRLANSDVQNSITNPASTVFDDQDSPYTLNQWIERSNSSPGNADKYINEYNLYIKLWRDRANLKPETAKNAIKEVYVRFLKEVALTYTNAEERRFLENVDLSDPVEVDAALPFYAKKLREIIETVYKNRHQTSFQKIKYSLRGNKQGLEKAIYDTIINYILYSGVSSVRSEKDNKLTIDHTRIIVDEMYDDAQDYFDTQYRYTNGDEFLDEFGKLYIGYYHIHYHDDGRVIYMIGKEHSSEPHGELTRLRTNQTTGNTTSNTNSITTSVTNYY